MSERPHVKSIIITSASNYRPPRPFRSKSELADMMHHLIDVGSSLTETVTAKNMPSITVRELSALTSKKSQISRNVPRVVDEFIKNAKQAQTRCAQCSFRAGSIHPV